MGSSYIPPVNLASPGPIGATTPAPITGTTITATTTFAGPAGSTSATTFSGTDATTGIYFTSGAVRIACNGDLKWSVSGDSLVGTGNSFGFVYAPTNGGYGVNGRDAAIIAPGAYWVIGAGGGSATERARFSATGTRLVLPTSASGLVSGDLWNNSGVVNIVP